MKGSKSIATANADANGDFAFSFRATSTGTYTVVWQRASDKITFKTSGKVTVRVK